MTQRTPVEIMLDPFGKVVPGALLATMNSQFDVESCRRYAKCNGLDVRNLKPLK